MSSWIDLDGSCDIDPHVFADELQIELGSRTASLGLSMTEDMVDKLSVVLADAKARFRELGSQERCEPRGVA
ncbi:MAG: hypothetical protein ACRDTS_05220 [Mycobacterium sp.]